MTDSPHHYQSCRAGSRTLARRPHGGRALTQIQRTLSYAGFDPATPSLAFRKRADPTLAVERMGVRSTAHHQPICSNEESNDSSQVRVHSTENADLPPDQRKYPVVILRAGLAALVTGYTALAEDLASHGYIVVGPDAPYRTAVVVFPDGRVVSRPSKYNLELLPESEKVPFATRL